MASSSTSKSWSETRNGRIVVAAGMVALFVLVFWLTRQSRQMLAEPAALMVEDQYLWFGEVWEDPAFVWTLPIRNTTNQEIEIGGFITSCTCAKMEPSKLTIAPQATAEVHLTLNLAIVCRESKFTVQDFKVAIKPQMAKGNGPQAGWVVYGRIKKPFTIDPPVIHFEESLVRGQPFEPRTAIVTYRLDVAELKTRCDSPSLKAELKRDEENPRRFRLEIQPQKDMAAGPFNHIMHIAASTPDKKG